MNDDFEYLKSEVSNLLRDFDELFNSNSMAGVRRKFPRYVALYTPLIHVPDIVMIGENPSYFIGGASVPKDKAHVKEEDKRTNQLKGLHKINAYLDMKGIRAPIKYHKVMVDSIFANIVKEHKDFIRNKVMGWNTVFVQGNPLLIENNKDQRSLNFLIERSQEISKKLLKLVKPKLIICVGVPSAQNSGLWIGSKKNWEAERYKSGPTPWGGKKIQVHHFSRYRKEDVNKISKAMQDAGVKGEYQQRLNISPLSYS